MTDEKAKEEKIEEVTENNAVESQTETAAPAKPEPAPKGFRVLLGEKVGMTQQFTPTGECYAVTEVQVGPCYVQRVKSSDGPDGYSAVLLAYGKAKEKSQTKADLGQFKTAGCAPARYLKEIRVPDSKEFKVGQTVEIAERFAAGDYVDVQGTSKGKGFAGVMKRHNFRGLPASHGASDKERSPGSISSRRTLGRVLPGQRMAGHMGHVTVTVQKLEIISVDAEKNRIFLNGSVPGPRRSYVVLRETKKHLKRRSATVVTKGPRKDKMGNIIK